MRAPRIVGDSRYIPFSSKFLDVVFSFSVLHHFNKNDTKLTLKQISRTLKTNGTSLIQLSNAYGLRNVTIEIKRGFKRQSLFDMQYWTPRELKDVFEDLIGPTILVPHAYLSTGALMCDLKYLPFKYRLLVRTSEMLRKISQKIKWMELFADSIYVKSVCK
jgi:ubiquinone/menaquinone biosynthesis C-methylase UbiE